MAMAASVSPLTDVAENFSAGFFRAQQSTGTEQLAENSAC